MDFVTVTVGPVQVTDTCVLDVCMMVMVLVRLVVVSVWLEDVTVSVCV